MKKRILAALFVAQFVLNVGVAQTPKQFKPAEFADANRKAKLQAAMPLVDNLYKAYAEKNHFPAYAFAVVLDGELLYKNVGGWANIEEKIPANGETMFRIASMSKSFTTMAILQLRDAGKLKLDDPVFIYIPSIKDQILTKDGAPITIRHLMSHQAGFPEDNPWGDRQLSDTEADLIALIEKGLSFSNSTGAHYEYSNLGFAMLGYIIHKVSGLTYDAYIKKAILDPLGMQHTTYEYTTISKMNLAKGYRTIKGNWVNVPLLKDGIYGAMGGMITSIDDFAKYVALHQAAWPERNEAENKVIKRSTVREMHQPYTFIDLNPNYQFPSGKKLATTSSYSYGLNWMHDAEGKTSIGHSGGLPGFGSNWRFMPEYGLGVIFFANHTYAPTSKMNLIVLDTLVQVAQLQPRVVLPSPILLQRQKELIQLLPTWESTPAIFAENFFDDYLIDELKAEAKNLFDKAGEIKVVGKMVAENQLRGYCILEGANQKLKLSFTLSPENPALIQEYHLELLNQ
ncbi:MAG: beta-lactamase family protein [Sediminibacterium sp.]|nr:beta-lactamase family protein [Sediminibacterium sp.]MBP6144623.1 beta-lactamase family protein [Sediminibacterium sp.]